MINERHAAHIAASAIIDTIRDARPYRTITLADIPELLALGFTKRQARPGLLIPQFDVHGENGQYQLRPDEPRIIVDTNGKARSPKYENPRGSKNKFDVNPVRQHLLRDADTDIWFFEGSKKLDSALSADSELCRCGIAIRGVDNWLSGGMAVACFDSVAWKGPNGARRVYICLDNDPNPRTRANVLRSRTRLAAYLCGRGAEVWIIDVPPGLDGSKGAVDDFLAAGGTIEALVALAVRFAGPNPQAAPVKVNTDIDGDIAVAERILAKHRSDVLYCPARTGFYLWMGTHWEYDEKEKIQTLAEDVVRSIYQEAAVERDPERQEALAKLAASHSRYERMRGALAVARSHVSVVESELDANCYLLNVRNGTIDLRTGELRPHQRTDRITKRIDIYYDSEAKAPRWQQYLNQVFSPPGDTDPDFALIEYIQRAIGYSLSGDQREKCFWICHGGTDTGKSTFAETMKAFAGSYAQTQPASLFLLQRPDAPQYDIARLKGIRLVIASETAESRRIDAEKVKLLTGADSISARRPYEMPFDFSPTHHLWLLGNHRPKAPAGDDALWNRIKLIPFDNRFSAEPDASHPMDRTLPAALLKEMPGILAWAVEGARQYFATGHLNGTEPRRVRMASEAYRSHEDLIAQFVAECIQRQVGSSVSFAQVWKAFLAWNEGGRDRIGKHAFNVLLHER